MERKLDWRIAYSTRFQRSNIRVLQYSGIIFQLRIAGNTKENGEANASP